ncbi:hypothetical protein RQP46_006965 [Phenoliferia psychrophenolica]
MFECAALQRSSELRVLHEPMGDAWYWGSERMSSRYSPEACEKAFAKYKEATYAKVWGDVMRQPAPGQPPRTFSKDMAQYIFPLRNSSTTEVPSLPKEAADVGNPTLIPSSQLLDPSIRHTFLIRTPKKAVPSYHRLCYPGAPTGFDYWDPDEAGYREERLLFDYLRANGLDPLVLDSEDLLANPKSVMQTWCDEVQIPFEERMLSWDEGTREHFEKWAGWHEAAENSTGVGRGLKDSLTMKHGSSEQRHDLPQEVQDCIEACMEDYEYLRSFVRKAILPISDPSTRALEGWVDVATLKQDVEAGRTADEAPLSTVKTSFPRTKPYSVISPDTTLEDLEVFLDRDGVSFALVTDSNRKFVLGLVTRDDLSKFNKRRNPNGP